MEIFKSMEMGESKTFHLESSAEIYSGQANAYRAANLLDCKFTCNADHSNNTLTITKNKK